MWGVELQPQLHPLLASDSLNVVIGGTSFGVNREGQPTVSSDKINASSPFDKSFG
jgi:hypothetical protein